MKFAGPPKPLPPVVWHEMVATVPSEHFRCAKCGYESDLAGAIRHAVERQERA